MRIFRLNIISEKKLRSLLENSSDLKTPSVTCPTCRTQFKRKPSVVESLANMAGDITVKQLLYIYNRHCVGCDVTFKSIDDATIDHIQPKAKGGKNGLHNYQLMCEKCNKQKGNRWDPRVHVPSVQLAHLLDATEKAKLNAMKASF